MNGKEMGILLELLEKLNIDAQKITMEKLKKIQMIVNE